MPTIYPSAIADLARLTLTESIKRLSDNANVAGIVLLGSTGTPSHSAHSDYDLLLIMDRLPVRLRVVVTVIAGRMADIIIVGSTELEKVVVGQVSWKPDSWEAKYTDWLRTGTIAFDRRGLVSHLQEGLTNWSEPHYHAANESDHYRTIAQINYNVRQNERMIRKHEPPYQLVVDIRMLYSILELFMAYFSLREIPFRGEKQAVGYLQRNDPAFLSQLQHCLSATEQTAKVVAYRKLAEMVLASDGGLWPGDYTSVSLDPDTYSMEAVRAGLAFWSELVRPQANAS